MYDLNYFSILKRQKQNNKGLQIALILLLVFLLVLNGALLGFAFYTYNKLETKIANNQIFIDSPETKENVKQINIMSKEATIAADYLAVLKKAAGSIDQSDMITVDLIDHIRALAPIETFFRRAEYDHSVINIECFSTEVTDPMNFYHALLEDDQFSFVSMPGFILSPEGIVNYSIQMKLKGGENK